MQPTRIAIAVTAALALPAQAQAIQIDWQKLWTYNHVVQAPSGAKAFGSEIVSFDEATGNLWVVGTDANVTSGQTGAGGLGAIGRGGVDVLSLGGTRLGSIDLTGLGPNSVAIGSGKAGVVLTGPDKTQPGQARFYDLGTFAQVGGNVAVGPNPDSITTTPDGSKFLVANEGEPLNYTSAANDPAGSVSIIDGTTLGVQTADFTAFNASVTALRNAGVRIYGPNATAAQDLEPEYVAVSADGTKAFVTLQENNAIAIVDIATATVTEVKPLGLKNHALPGKGIDASDRDGAGNAALNGNIQNWNVFGMYQPDGIAGFSQGGQQYYVTANEGDARADFGYVEEFRLGDLAVANGVAGAIDPALDAALKMAHGNDYRTNNDKLSRLNVTNATSDTDGDGDIDRIEVYGARSFTILDANGNFVFDSGDALEQIIKAQFPALWDDSRSDNKGPEPEAAIVGNVAGRNILFLGLERTNAVMMWDLTNVGAPTFIDMLFTAGDVGPEGLDFLSYNGRYYLAVASEVSETTTLYSINPVPVPAAMWLFGSALGAMGFVRRRS